MFLALGSAAVGVFVGFVCGTIFFVIFNDQRGLSTTALWWLVGLYLGVGETGGGLAVQAISKDQVFTASYLVCCTVIFLIIAVPTFYDYRRSGRLMHVRVQERQRDASALKK